MGSGVHSSFVVSSKAVPALSAKDAERLFRLVGEAENLGGDQLFTPELLVELGELIEADLVSYSELDRVRRRDVFYACRPGEEELDGDLELYWEVVNEEHPVCARESLGDFRALKLSDFLTLRELRASRWYDLWLRPDGIERELSVAIPSPLWHTKVLMFDRGRGRDFSERDRTLLELLRPHLARLWDAARTRRLLRATLTELDRVSETEPSGVIVLGNGSRVDFASPPARRLLRDFFGESGTSLPPELFRRLEVGTLPLVRRRGAKELTIELSNGTLLLRERPVAPDLTAREREVLSWVAQGKTNAEIAELLWLAPSTVRKHLENVYAKLGVNTRTAAVARFLGLLDAEAS